MLNVLPFIAAFLMWAAFEPIGVGSLIIPAAFCWLLLIRTEKALPKNSYKLIYAGSALAWLALLQGIRLAYWPLYAGWIALSLYVAIYVPLFVLVSRYLVHRWRWPTYIAAPLVWAGTELLRCYVMTGFGGCLLSHAMAEHPVMIQLASHVGPHLLSGLFVFYAAVLLELSTKLPSIRSLLSWSEDHSRPFTRELDWKASESAVQLPAIQTSSVRFVILIAIVATTIGLSWRAYSAGQQLESERKPLLKVALIQENAETRFDSSYERAEKSLDRYLKLTLDTGAREKDLDLIVWPESTFTPTTPFFDWDGKRIPENYADYVGDPQTVYEDARRIQRYAVRRLEWLQWMGVGDGSYWGQATPPQDAADETMRELPALLLGVTRHRVREEGFKIYNSVAFKGKGSGPVSFYDKRKLVMFGEYIPFAEKWPDVYKTLGMSVIGVGPRWQVFDVGGVKVAPSICFEDMLPQAMQAQTARLTQRNEPPDVLVNVTNDGWFRGSSMLDHHFACAVFTAVENRRPMLVAANTGISTWVSGNGVVKAKSKKLTAEAIIAEPIADGRWGLWQTVGDWPAILCAALLTAALVDMLFRSQVKQYRLRKSVSAADAPPS